MNDRVHIVGAGLSGLACAVRLAGAGLPVTLYEAAGQAGGRCRSLRDKTIGREIDNGNHLLLSGNRAALAYLAEIGAADQLTGPPRACFPFLDLKTGDRWTLRPNDGRLPWWLLKPSRRVAAAGAFTHAGGFLKLATASAAATVDTVLGKDPLFERLWEPLAVAILNTPTRTASARLLWRVLAESFAAGGAACRPLVARYSLDRSFVAPALAFLHSGGIEPQFNRRLTGLERRDGRIAALRFGDGFESVGDNGRVILALPATAAHGTMPELDAPADHHAIVNAHYRLDRPAALPGGAPLLGLIGGTAQWLFVRGDVVSVTVSAADDLAQEDSDTIAGVIWRDVAAALDLPCNPVPPHRIIKERRATFAQTPAANRPGTRTALGNLYLAGDWTDTGLPATIEGAICSGHAAAAAIIRDLRSATGENAGNR